MQEKNDFDDAKEKYPITNIPQRKNQGTSHLSISNKNEIDTQMSMTIKPVKYRDPSMK